MVLFVIIYGGLIPTSSDTPSVAKVTSIKNVFFPRNVGVVLIRGEFMSDKMVHRPLGEIRAKCDDALSPLLLAHEKNKELAQNCLFLMIVFSKHFQNF